MEKQTYFSIKTIKIQKIIGSLYIRPWENSEVEVRYNSSKSYDVNQNGEQLIIETGDSLLISAPAIVNFTIDEVQGNCSSYGKINQIQINKVFGNLAIAEATDVSVEEIAGNCALGPIDGKLTIRKVGGNLHSEYMKKGFSFDKIGGNLSVIGELGDLSCTVGGNVKLFCKELTGNENTIHSGGNIKMNVEPGLNFHLSARAGAHISVNVGGEKEKAMSRTVNKTFGEGGTKITLKAGGNVKISDTDLIMDQAYEQKPYDDGIWTELEQRVEKNQATNTVFDFSSILNLEKDISQEVTEKTKLAQERINTAMNKLNKKLESLTSDVDVSDRVNKKPAKPVGVSDEERMMILTMLQEKKITAEEADQLLQILEEV